MENERVIFYHEIRPNQSFRIVATGDVDAEMIKALKAFADFQAAILGFAAMVANKEIEVIK